MADSSSKIDLVYPVSMTRDLNEELRYSLRSVEKNLPHRKVWVLSGRISWLSDEVNLMPMEYLNVSSRYKIVNMKLKEACLNPEISDPFYLMNDDFFILKKMKSVPILNRGSLKSHYEELKAKYQNSEYMKELSEAGFILKEGGFETKDFELHLPMLVEKEKLLKIINEYPYSGCRRSLYANMYGLKGKVVKDCKIYEADEPIKDEAKFASSSPNSWSEGALMRKMVIDMFNERSKYERAK